MTSMLNPSPLSESKMPPRALDREGEKNRAIGSSETFAGQLPSISTGGSNEIAGDSYTLSGSDTNDCHRNQQYSITALTDSSGTVTDRYVDTAYDYVTFSSVSKTEQKSSAAGNRYTYAAREWDTTLGLHYLPAGWMNGLTAGFLTRDPIGYEGSPYCLYEVFYAAALSLVDPTGEVGGTLHHGYPLHLGGLQNQPLWQFATCELHQAAHNYMASQGFKFGDPGRAAWALLTPAQQAHHIKQALLAGGVPENLIDDYIAQVMRGANPGVKTPRVGPTGPIITMFSAVLIVLLNPTTCSAAEPLLNFDGCTHCYCKTYARVEVIPSWWNLSPSTVSGRTIPITPVIDIGKMDPAICNTAASSLLISTQSVIGYTINNWEDTICKPGSPDRIPFFQ